MALDPPYILSLASFLSLYVWKFSNAQHHLVANIYLSSSLLLTTSCCRGRTPNDAQLLHPKHRRPPKYRSFKTKIKKWKSQTYTWQVKKIISSFSKKNLNLTIDTLSLSIPISPEPPSFDLPTPNFAGSSNLNSVPVPGPERRVKRFRCFRNGRG